MFRVGSKNLVTVYWENDEMARFICVAMSPAAARLIASTLNAAARRPGGISDEAVSSCPQVAKREIKEV